MLYTVWPEQSPNEAIHCQGFFAMMWAMVGPKGWLATFRGKRMCKAWPCHPSEHPRTTAARCERLRATTQR